MQLNRLTMKQLLCAVASQPINEGGQSTGAPGPRGPQVLRVKICHEIITDTLLTSDTLTISGNVISPRTGYCLYIVCYNPCYSGQCRAFVF